MIFLLEQRNRVNSLTETVRKAVKDPLEWLQRYTRTKDPHWREAGAQSPYRPFPDKPYYRAHVEAFQKENIIFSEKSRDLMITWLYVGLFTHAAMTVDGLDIVFQTQKQDKAEEMMVYARTLYREQPQWLQDAFPLIKHIDTQPDLELFFLNGSRIFGIPGGKDQIRSYHPWGYFNDESAFQPEAGECYDHSLPVAQKIVFNSSQGPGWFADFTENKEEW